MAFCAQRLESSKDGGVGTLSVQRLLAGRKQADSERAQTQSTPRELWAPPALKIAESNGELSSIYRMVAAVPSY